TEAIRNGFKSRPFGLLVKRVVGIGAIDDLAEQHQCGVSGELVLLQDRLERAFLAVVAQFDILYVIRNRAEAVDLIHDLVRWDKNKLGILVDEFLDEPGARDAIDLNVFSCDPFHLRTPIMIVAIGFSSTMPLRRHAKGCPVLSGSSAQAPPPRNEGTVMRGP